MDSSYSITGAKIWRVGGIQSLAPRFLSSRMGIVGIRHEKMRWEQ
jgi:hypothetical protein